MEQISYAHRTSEPFPRATLKALGLTDPDVIPMELPDGGLDHFVDGPFTFETGNARRIAELTLYIRQCHAEHDLEELGKYLEKHPEYCSAW